MLPILMIGLLAACAVDDVVSENKTEANPDDANLTITDLGAADAAGPNMGDLQWEERVEGALGADNPYEYWTIEIFDGSNAYIDLATRSGDPNLEDPQDTYLMVYRRTNRGWRRIATNDDCSSDTYNSCLELENLRGGEYAILATTYGYARRWRADRADYHLFITCRDGEGQCAEAQLCGSRGLGPCAEGQYCDWSDDSCGAVDRPGVCTVRPQACTRDYRPVCGCDGNTYGNACTAAAAGVDQVHDGECERAGQGVGETCGGIAALQCEDGLVCDYSGNQECVTDIAGQCAVPENRACTMHYDPVCGCDGRTYGNDCVRITNYAALAHEGACE